ncbi:putative adipose-regulatory protein-domain-containing protein, partial [Dimargaris cristalligena]
SVRAVVGSLAVGLAVFFALLSYASLYYLLIPQLSHELPVYFNYAALPQPAVALVPIAPDGESQVFSSAQGYVVSLRLRLPTSSTNRQLGNFMVSADLKDSQNQTVYHSNRPGLLHYQSTITRTLATFMRAVPLLLGWGGEAQELRIVLLENMVDQKHNPITHMYVTLSNPALQTYSATAHFDVQFTGLRFYMYYWSAPTAAVFVMLSIMWQVFAALVAWRVL